MVSLEILNSVKINIIQESGISTLKNIFNGTKSNLSFNKGELINAQTKLKQAFVEFHRKLQLLKNYSFLNQLAFSKILKKYDKITSRNASKGYLEMVENSYLGQSDEDELEISEKLLGIKGGYHGTLVVLKKKATGEIIVEGRHSLFSKPTTNYM
ncbi:hypothetical protein LXL04_030445 [Taraxacum kok-saghyz]